MLVSRHILSLRLSLNVIKSFTRCYHPTPLRLYQLPLQPYTWKTWLFYRRDGIPRSKLKGTLFTTVAAGAMLLAVQTLALLDTVITQNAGFRVLIGIQRLDAEYASYDFSTISDTVAYFRRIIASFPPHDPIHESVDEAAKAMRILLEKREEAHVILRGCFEELHTILSQNKEEDPLKTTMAVMQILSDALAALKNTLDQPDHPIKDSTPSEGDSYGIVG